MIQTLGETALPPISEEALAKAKTIVTTSDERAIQLAAEMLQMDDDSLIEMAGTAKAIVRKIEMEAFEALERQIGADRLIVKVAEAVMKARILERGAKMLPSDTYKCAIETTKVITKRIDVLRGLEGKVPADRLKKALWIDGVDIAGVEPEAVAAIVAAGAKPTYNTNATQLKKLATDFGGEIAQIVEQGVVYEEGSPRLVFEPLEAAAKNVTPLKAVQ